MFCYPVYKLLKEQLNTIAPVFYFIGQYTRGKDNTSYRLPAIYVEMPGTSNIQFWGRRAMAIKPAQIKIHYISHAPFKNHDNTVQDSAIAAHEAVITNIDFLLQGFIARDSDNNLLTQSLIPLGVDTLNFQDNCVYSVLTYTTEIYSRHRQ